MRRLTSSSIWPVGQKDVAVVLLELPHPGEPAERAGHLVPVQHVEGGVAERQLPIAVLLRAEYSR